LHLWYSMTFICPVSCVPYVASFSGLYIFDCPFGILWGLFVLCLVYAMLPISLDCVFLIAPLVLSDVYLSCVLCTLCCQFLWIVYFWLPLWYSLKFICPVSCVPYVASFSGLWSESTKGAIKNTQSREIGNIAYTRHRTNKLQRIPKGQSKIYNPEKLAT
jgi:hypothetical protein